MRRAGRLLLNFLSGLSLLTFLAALALWAWSYHRAEEIEWDGLAGQKIARVSQGGLGFCWDTYVDRDPESWALMPTHLVVGHSDPSDPLAEYVPLWNKSWTVAGFGYGRGSPDKSGWLVIPVWFVAVLSAILPMRLVGAIRRWRRARRQCCVVCGYDLRATPERCPECGQGPPRTSEPFWTRRRAVAASVVCVEVAVAAYGAYWHWSMRAVYAAKQIASEPDTPQSLRLKELVRVVRDASRPKPERGNAFLEFWKLALYPGADFVRVCARYGVQDWISDNTLADWTYSSATPLDEDRWPSANNSIFAVFAPASVQNQRNSIDVCFSLRGKIRGEELATDLREVYLDKAKILHAVIDPNRGFGDEPLYP